MAELDKAFLDSVNGVVQAIATNALALPSAERTDFIQRAIADLRAHIMEESLTPAERTAALQIGAMMEKWTYELLAMLERDGGQIGHA